MIAGVKQLLSILVIALIFSLITGCGGSDDGPANVITPEPENPISGGVSPIPDPGNKTQATPEFLLTVPDPASKDPVSPTPNGISDIVNTYEATELIGQWTSMVEGREQRFSFSAGGVCEAEEVAYSVGEAKLGCKWAMLDSGQKKFLLIEFPGYGWYFYGYEKGFGDNFRLTGGDLKAESRLYSLAAPSTREGLFPGRWFASGIWKYFVNSLGAYNQLVEFKPDNSLQVLTYRSIDNKTLSTRLGTWSVTPTHLNYQIDETQTIDEAPLNDILNQGPVLVQTPVSGNYLLKDVSMNLFTLEGISSSSINTSFTRLSSILYRDDRFVGHYTGPSTTMIITKIDIQNYNLSLTFEGGTVDILGQIDIASGNLIFDLPPRLHQQGITTLVLAPNFNGIFIVSSTATITAYVTKELTKMSETVAKFPSTVVGGTWQQRSKYGFNVLRMTLLPDGQYLSRNGVIEEEGTYQLDVVDEVKRITIDPICAAPYFYNYGLINDQWVWREQQSFGEDTYKVLHYEAGSQEMVDIATLEYNSNQAIENAKWKVLFPLAAIDSNYSPLPFAVTDTSLVRVTDDPMPQSVYTGKQVFAADQVYTWRMPSIYCLGAGVAGCGSGYFHFYKNGRLLYYSKDVWGIAAFTGSPIGNATHIWERYYIEGDQIIISDTVKIPLLKGYRKIQFGEFCYSNLDWTGGTVKPR